MNQTELPAVRNIHSELSTVSELWSPRVLGQVNDQYLKVARVQGELTWHQHDAEDELFLVLKGALKIEYENGTVELGPGDFHVVPKGTMHNPVAAEECEILLIETVTTAHTGTKVTAKTRSIEEQLASG
ncbi:MAG: cupin domain-containing protein [Pseudomonadales bacterium]